MPIYRTKHLDNFTLITNAIANDANVSPTATTALIYLISKPPHWQFNARDLKRRLGVGLNKVYRTMNELIRAGYYANLEDAKNERINSESMSVQVSDWTTPEKGSVMEKFVTFACSINALDLGSNPYKGMSDEPRSLFDRWLREETPFN